MRRALHRWFENVSTFYSLFKKVDFKFRYSYQLLCILQTKNYKAKAKQNIPKGFSNLSIENIMTMSILWQEAINCIYYLISIVKNEVMIRYKTYVYYGVEILYFDIINTYIRPCKLRPSCRIVISKLDKFCSLKMFCVF